MRTRARTHASPATTPRLGPCAYVKLSPNPCVWAPAERAAWTWTVPDPRLDPRLVLLSAVAPRPCDAAVHDVAAAAAGKLKAEDVASAVAPRRAAATSPAASGSGAGARPPSSGSQGTPTPGAPSYSPDQNPFLPVTEAQRMMGGAYPDVDIARASLAQMNEISRRAVEAGLSFAAPRADAAQQDGPQPPTMGKIFAAAANLMPERPLSRQDALARIEELTRARPTSAQGGLIPPPGPSSASLDALAAASAAASSSSAPGPGIYTDASDPYGAMLADATADERYARGLDARALSHEGLQVFTVGHLMPKSTLDDENGNWAFDPAHLAMPAPAPAAAAPSGTVGSAAVAALDQAVVMPTPQGMGGDPAQEGEDERQQPIVVVPDAVPSPSPGPGAAPGTSQKLRVRRSTYVPGWAVPPRVLLVDDDAISRKLSSKFLQVFGCTIDVAVDGDVAVSKMNLEKYDLVLMVRSRASLRKTGC